MKNILILGCLAVCLSSCGVSALYNWGGSGMSGTSQYEQLAYKNYDKQSPQSLCQLIVMYEDLVKNPGGSRKVPPPGICAEYGYMLLLPETATTFMNNATKAQKSAFDTGDFNTLFREYGLEMMRKEIEYYPEAATFIRPLIERFSKQ